VTTTSIAFLQSRGLPTPDQLRDRSHGTRLRYISSCRCVPCRAANSRYESHRRAARLRGEWEGLVDAAPVRAHLQRLSRHGVGYKSVAVACDVSRTVLAAVKNGRRRKVRAGTARKVLAVDAGAAAAKALIDGRPTWRLINELLSEGFTKQELARRLGSRAKAQPPKLQIRRDRITAATAARVRRFYDVVMAGA
jgi:hypothetical protein